MEYDFYSDEYGQPCANFSMDHEAFGLWLVNEISRDLSLIEKILADISTLKSRQRWDASYTGTEFSLYLSQDEATVTANSLDLEPENLAEDLELYDAESFAGCGLEDFSEMLNAWLEFIN